MGRRQKNVNSANPLITADNLMARCYANGFKGVPPLAKKIHRHQKTVWRAVRWPDQFGPTYDLIVSKLPNPEVQDA